MDVNKIYKAVAVKNNCDINKAKILVIMDILKNDVITHRAVELAIKRKYSHLLTTETLNNNV